MLESELNTKLREALSAIEKFEKENGSLKNARLYKTEIGQTLDKIQKKSYEPDAESTRCPRCNGSGRA